MSNDKPQLRFSTNEIHNRQNHGDRRQFNTLNTAKQQFGTRGLSGAPAPLV